MNFELVIIGTGNVAHHLAHAYHNGGSAIINIYGRNTEKSSELANNVGAKPVNRLEDLYPDADLYIIAVSDDSIETIVRKLPFNDRLVVHTSGATPISIFKPYQKRYGVMWPLQTLSKDIPIDISGMPVCIEGSDNETLNLLEAITLKITNRAYKLSSEERRIAHLAAVIANNFTNHLNGIAFDLLISHKLPAEIILPLITETARIAGLDHPFRFQTGPAARNDQKIIERHLTDLKDRPDYQEIYRIITKSIQENKLKL